MAMVWVDRVEIGVEMEVEVEVAIVVVVVVVVVGVEIGVIVVQVEELNRLEVSMAVVEVVGDSTKCPAIFAHPNLGVAHFEVDFY
jgi:hypothetical protein